MDKSKKSTYIIAAVTFIVLVLGIYFLFVFKKGAKEIQPKEFTYGEIKKLSDVDIAKRPYVTLTPTSDGAEIIISMENMSFFDRIEYELTYQADNPTAPGTKIPRGSTGDDINTKDQKYKKSTLLGTASRGVRSPDTGIEDGKLTLHLFKGDQEYLSESNWDISKFGQKPTTLESKDGNIKIQIPGLGKDYWVILGDTVGIPSGGQFDIKKVHLPNYGAFSIAGAFGSPGVLSIKTEDKNSNFYLLNHLDNTWQQVDSTYNGGNLEAKISTFGTFVTVTK